jgi:hypothetical protein
MRDEFSFTSLRPCGKCREWLPVDQFHRRGVDGRIVWCKPCKKVYDAAYHARHRDRVLAQKRGREAELVAWMRSRKSGPCVDCGGTFHPAAMTFDHLPGASKRADIATLTRRSSMASIRAEIEKCELVCANCHAVRTFTRRETAKAA